jgi:hypothetical protein
MYAIVHKSAIKCVGPNGGKYDRVKVLQDLGYHVTILGSPIYKKLLSGYVKDNIDSDAGERDFLRLRSLTFDNHPAVGKFMFLQEVCAPCHLSYLLFKFSSG